jgi:hypothetical protein
VRITLESSANGALRITGTRITRGKNAKSAAPPIRSYEDGENKKAPRISCIHNSSLPCRNWFMDK